MAFDVPSWGDQPIPSWGDETPSPAARIAPIPGTQDAPAITDYFKNVGAAGHAEVANWYSMAAQHEQDPAMQKYYDDMATYHKASGQQIIEGMSDGGQAAANGTLRGHGFASTMMGLAGGVPSMAAPTAAAIGGGLTLGPVGAAGAGVIGWGGEIAAAATNTARDYIINQAPLEELKKDPNFASKLGTMSEDDARRVYATEQITKSLLEAKAFAGGAAGAALMGEEAAGILPGLTRGVIRRTLLGSIGGAAGAAVQTPITDLALGNVTPGLEKTPGQIFGETVQSMETMGALGAAGGALHRRQDPNLPKARKPTDAQLDSEAQPGKATSVGSETQGLKPEITKGVTEAPGVPPRSQATAPPPPSGIVDDAQKDAMAANQPPPKPPPKPPPETPSDTPGVTTEPTGEIPPGAQPRVAQPGAPPTGEPTAVAGRDTTAPATEVPPTPQKPATAPPTGPSVDSGIMDQIARRKAELDAAEAGRFPEGSPSVHDTFQNNIPETRATLEQQVMALANKTKQMVLVTPGSTAPHFLPDVMKADKNIKVMPLKDGSQAIYRDDGPDKLNKSKILKAVTANKLNDLLEMGPVTQTEAVERVNAGQTPMATVERTPAGTEVKAAAGTTETAPAQKAALEATKAAPENTVATEPVGKVIGERLADQDAQAKAGLAATQVTPRVLKDITVPAAEGYKPPGITTVTEKPAEPGKDPARAQARLDNNKLADSIVSKTPVTRAEVDAAVEGKGAARVNLIKKFNQMLEEAKAGGWKMPRRIEENVDEAQNHSRGSLTLEEANRVVRKIAKEGAAKTLGRLKRRLDLIEKNDFRGYIQDRIREAEEAKGVVSAGRKEPIEEPVKTAEEEEAEKAKAEAEKIKAEEAARIEVRRKESEEMRAKGLEPAVITPGVSAEKPKFEAVTLKRRRVVVPSERMEDVERPAYGGVQHGGTGQFETAGRAGQRMTVNYLQKMSAKEALNLVNPGHFPGFTKRLVSKLVEHLAKILPDVDVHIIDGDEMDKLDDAIGTGMYNRTKGYYQPTPEYNHVVLNSSYLNDPVARSNLILHELFHSATYAGFKDFKLMSLARALHGEVLSKFKDIYDAPRELRYGLTSPKELITEIISNPAWHDFLKDHQISKELADAMGIPKWRKPSMFNAALTWFTKALGLSPHDYNVVEAAFSIAEKAMWAKEPAAEMAYIQREHGLAPTEYSMSMEDARKGVVKAAKDTIPAARGFQRKVNDWTKVPLEWIEQATQEKWGGGQVAKVARTIMENVNRAGADVDKILKKTDMLMQRLSNFQQENPGQYNKLADFLINSTSYGADLRDRLGSGRNRHIDVKNNQADTSLEYHAAIASHPSDYQSYWDKSTSPETRALYSQVIDTFSKMNKDLILSHRATLVEDIRQEIKGLSYDNQKAIEKAISRTPLDIDEQNRFGDDKNIQALRDYDAATARALRGPYFSLQRIEGDKVVTAEHEYEKPTRGSKVEDYDHRYSFDDRKDVLDYIKKLPEAIRAATNIKIVRYLVNPDTGEKEYTIYDDKLGRRRDIRAADIPATGQLHEEFQVQVNPEHFELADSEVHGEEIRARLQATPGVRNVSAVLPRKTEAEWARGINAQQVNSVIDRIEGMKSKTNAEKQAAIQALRHVTTASLPGNRLSKSFLERERTAGASRDVVAIMDRYRNTVARIQAMDPYRKTISDSLSKFEDLADANRDNANIQQMYNTFNDRVNGFQGTYIKDMSVNPLWNDLAAFVNMKDLVSPGFFLQHELHIPTRVAPDLAAEVGGLQGTNIIQKIFRRGLGAEAKTIGRAYKTALTQAWKYDFEPTDVVSALKREFGVTADEAKMIEWQRDQGLIQNTGADYSQSYGRMGTVARLAAKARNISQEALGSAEIFNKFTSSLMYYEAAKLKKLTGEEAYRYVYDHVAKTSGHWSAFHRMGMLNDPRMRIIAQYRSWPMLLARHVVKLMWNSLHKDTPWEVRARAFRELGYMVLSATALSGVQGGTPYPIRMLDDLLSYTGLTAGWAKHMDELRHGLVSEFGVTGATMLMDGVGASAGLYLGHRGGISDPLGLNYLLETAHDEGGVFKWLAGAPAGYAGDSFNGLSKLMSGDPMGAAQMLTPRVFSDPIKAWQDYTGGVQTRAGKVISPPLSLPQAIEEALGLTPISRVHAQQARAILGQEKQEQLQERTKISHLWAAGDRERARQLLSEYNARYPDNRTNLANVIKSATRPTVLGYPETPRTRRRYLEEQHIYGLDQ